MKRQAQADRLCSTVPEPVVLPAPTQEIRCLVTATELAGITAQKGI